MRRIVLSALAVSLAGLILVPAATATTYDVGYVSYDVTNPGVSAEFDIVNLTGPNSSAPDFPITSSVSLTSLALTVDGVHYGSSYFTLAPDGLSFNGAAEAAFLTATTATLTGDFSPTTITVGGSPVTISPGFTATITDSSGPLADGDLALITASTPTVGPPPPVPEPESLVLVGSGLAALAGLRRRFRLPSLHKTVATGAVLALGCAALVAPRSASATTTGVKLTAWTAPSSGQSGQTFVNLTGSGFPSGTISPGSVTVYLNSSCSTTGATTTKANSVTPVVGSTDRIQFEIPAGLPTGTYYVSIAGSSFTSTNCSEVSVQLSTVELASCVPTSSLAVTVGKNVDAYVPFSSWDYAYYTGIERVPLEGTDTAQNYATTGYVNSCASNSSTGEVVCTENATGVDVIKGATLTTLTSSSDEETGFSGGYCYNCGVGINAVNNTAVIAMGYSGGSSTSGVQVLNLASNTFVTPFGLQNRVSEDVSIDPGRNIILSPGEGGYYDLLKTNTAGQVTTEYANYIGNGTYGSGEPDSAAEDCTTGIALSSLEFTDQIYITDLTQAKFTAPVSPSTVGSWTAPGQFLSLNGGNGDAYSAGTCGISSAPGTGHLAVVTGEFGGNAYSVLKLPSTAGSGTPTLADYAYVSSMPLLPDSSSFSAGYDPHTVTAYTSPNSGKSYAVFADYEDYKPAYLGVVDLSCVLSLARTPGTNNVSADTTPCTRYIAIP